MFFQIESLVPLTLQAETDRLMNVYCISLKMVYALFISFINVYAINANFIRAEKLKSDEFQVKIEYERNLKLKLNYIYFV